MQPIKILYFEDNEIDVELVTAALKSGRLNYQMVQVSEKEKFHSALKNEIFNVILCDYALPGYNGMEALKYVQANHPDIPFIIVSGTLGESSAIETMKSGATDYVLKQNLSRLVPAIERALKEQQERIERRRAEESLKASEERYRTLVEGSGNSILTVSKTGDLLFANRASEALFGIRSNNNGKKLDAFLPKNLTSPLMREINCAVETEKTSILEKQSKLNGHHRWLEWRIHPLKNGGDMADSVLIIVMDTSDRKNAQFKLKQSYQKLQKTLTGIVSALTSTIEIRDPYTAGHQRRVAELACLIAENMGLSKDKIEGIRIASLVHDIGKIYIPTEILIKPGMLTESEFSLIKIHPQAGYDILKSIDFPWPVAKAILQHHERINGAGYPHGLRDGDIIIEAKIICVADVLETMASHRPYRPAKGIEKAIEEIELNKGNYYDSEVVESCLNLYKADQFVFLTS